MIGPQVQLTLLTAIVKLFLKKPSETQELVQQVLSLATQVSPERTHARTHTHTHTHTLFTPIPLHLKMYVFKNII